MTDWKDFPGPSSYDPAALPPMLASFYSVASKQDEDYVYDGLLFAIGNNHAGTLYPAAVAVAPLVIEQLLTSMGWRQSVASEILIELLVFSAEPGFEQFRVGGAPPIELEKAIRSEVRNHWSELLERMAAPDTQERVRVNLLDALECFGESLGELGSVLRAIPEPTGQSPFRAARQAFLAELICAPR